MVEDDTLPARPTKVGFVSLGCPKNLVDSEVMMGLLARAGAELSAASRGRRRHCGEYLLIHRERTAGIGEHDSGDGRT